MLCTTVISIDKHWSECQQISDTYLMYTIYVHVSCIDCIHRNYSVHELCVQLTSTYTVVNYNCVIYVNYFVLQTGFVNECTMKLKSFFFDEIIITIVPSYPEKISHSFVAVSIGTLVTIQTATNL